MHEFVVLPLRHPEIAGVLRTGGFWTRRDYCRRHAEADKALKELSELWQIHHLDSYVLSAS